jgi:glycosyltransferase involved in cell wall biosynthesis/2-polyprenyl-3-methyl-5-hydroxy-6-metoxy-1,4-benzoquinol methylase
MRKLICFVTKGLDFNGGSLDEKALGGSESAMIYMAKELAALGNIVYVYCPCDKPGVYDNVVYLPFEDYTTKRNFKFDVQILSRYVENIRLEDVANLTIYWMHDVILPGFIISAHFADEVYLMSEYQKSLWTDFMGDYKKMIHVTKNGFDIDLALNTKILPFDDRKDHYIFASRPERGLKVLLEKIWPRILQYNPWAKLHLCKYANPFVDDGKEYTEIDQLIAESKGIIQHGSLIKKELYELLGKCAYMPYTCNFPEISCINAIEAQAMGVMVITGNEYALKETVKTFTLVEGDYGSIDYCDNFIGCLEIFQDKKVFLRAMQDAIDNVRNNYSWRKIASEWDTRIDETFKTRYETNKKGIFKRLSENSDFITLSQVDPDFDPQIIKDVEHNNFHYNYWQVSKVKNMILGDVRIQSMIKKMDDYINKSERNDLVVLDLGAYDGATSGILYQKHQDKISKVIAYEGNPVAIESGKKVWSSDGEPWEWINDNVRNLAKYNLKADIIIAGEILEHLVEYEDVLNGIQDACNPGALVVISTPTGPWETIGQKAKTELDRRHLNHFEPMDILTIYQEKLTDGTFFIEPIWEIMNFRYEPCDTMVYGWIHNEPFKFHRPNYQEKAIKTRPYRSISVTILTRNSEDYLIKCLKSIEKLADEIIIVDTGSTDSTKEIAKRFTDKIYDYKWEEEDGLGDFSAARNFAVSKSTGDWILWIDSDEYLMNPEQLGAYTRCEHFDNFCIKQHQMLLVEDQTADQWPNRLFRNNGVHKFYGAIHEFPRLSDNEGHSELCINLPNVEIIHFGYLDAEYNRTAKVKRNHELLLKSVKKSPNRIDNFYYLIRDMMFFYQNTKDMTYLSKALHIWDNFPTRLTNNNHYHTWMNTFKLMQDIRQFLVDIEERDYDKYIDYPELFFKDDVEIAQYKRVKSILDKYTL